MPLSVEKFRLRRAFTYNNGNLIYEHVRFNLNFRAIVLRTNKMSSRQGGAPPVVDRIMIGFWVVDRRWGVDRILTIGDRGTIGRLTIGDRGSIGF